MPNAAPPPDKPNRPLREAIGIFAVAAYGTMAISAFLLPETKGKVLAA